MAEVYDFIVVGAGAAGCVLASRLAEACKNYKVLLVEAGGKNDEEIYQSYGERHSTLMKAPGYNWGYKTVPQPFLDGREIDQSRGKGLGGSTAINFCVYTRGSKADYDHWAHLVDDKEWDWDHALQRFKKIETIQPPPKDAKPYIDVTEANHGHDGPLQVGLPNVWEHEFGTWLDTIGEHRPKCLDHNSGNPIGVSVCQVAAKNGRRATAHGCFLARKPSNLTVKIDTVVKRVLFEGTRAYGIETDGAEIHAKKEVILSAGAIDTPKLLMLSGIGDTKQLQKHGIKTVHDLPGVGKNLSDRLFLQMVSVRRPGTHHRTAYAADQSPEALAKARSQFEKDGSGAMASYYLPQMISYVKSDAIVASKEFKAMDVSLQQRLQLPTKPHYEVLTHSPSPDVEAPEQYIAIAIAFDGAHGDGYVELRSSNPSDPPTIDPKFLSQEFERRVAVESIRETWDLLKQPSLAKDEVRLAAGPQDPSDDAILEFVRKNAASMWHMCGTVRMGKGDDPGACVDRDCRVLGVQGLRVVDMSVVPFLPSAHTQGPAYLIGATAAEKIIAEYA